MNRLDAAEQIADTSRICTHKALETYGDAFPHLRAYNALSAACDAITAACDALREEQEYWTAASSPTPQGDVLTKEVRYGH